MIGEEAARADKVVSEISMDNKTVKYVPTLRGAVARLISHDAPLGLPTGSGRLLMALGLVGSLVGIIAFGIDPNGIETLATAAVAFYFGTRNGKPTGG